MDVVAVTETWLHDGYFDIEILSSSQYTIFRKDRGGNKRDGDVLLAVKTDLLAYRRPDLEPQNSETLVRDLVSPNSFTITFCLCYRPPNCSLFMDYFACLQANLCKTSGRICIIGDFHMPSINWEYVIDLSNSADGIKFCNLINSQFRTQVVRESTRISHSSKSILDLFFYNHPEEIFDISAVEDLSSDHLVVSFSLLTKLKRLKKLGRTVHNLKKADLSGLKSALRNVSWDRVFVDNDIDASTACWYDMFLSCVNEFVPKVVIEDANRPSWIDKEVLSLIEKKSRTRHKAKLKSSVILWQRYRGLRRQVKKTFKFKKRSYLSKLGCSLRDNPRKFWSYHKAITTTTKIPGVMKHESVQATRPIDQANLFNMFFHSVIASPDSRSTGSCLLWQHGFLPGKSTVSQLSQVVHQFSNALERRQ